MNFTIGATQINTWKRFKLHYVAAVAGIALAIGAVVGAGELRGTDATSEQGLPSAVVRQDSADFGYGVWDTTLADRPVSVPAAPRSVIANSRPDQLLVYVVGSDAARRSLEHDIKSNPEWYDSTLAGVSTAFRIVVMEPGTDVGLENLDTLLPEASITIGNGPDLKFVDMR
jgi:hypothetical protein